MVVTDWAIVKRVLGHGDDTWEDNRKKLFSLHVSFAISNLQKSFDRGVDFDFKVRLTATAHGAVTPC